MLRHPLGGGRLAVVPGADRVEAVDRRHRRAAAGRDHHGPPRDERVLADADAPLSVEPALAAEDLDPAILQPGQLPRVVEIVDHLVAAVEHRLRVELPAHHLGDARHPARLAEQVGGPQQRLRGHAGVVGALAADQVLLDDRHRHPAVGEPTGADLSRRPGTEHDRVELLLAHASIPTRRPTIRPHSTGATGFDAVGPCERLQVEVAGGLVKPRQKPIRADHEFALAA